MLWLWSAVWSTSLSLSSAWVLVTFLSWIGFRTVLFIVSHYNWHNNTNNYGAHSLLLCDAVSFTLQPVILVCKHSPDLRLEVRSWMQSWFDKNDNQNFKLGKPLTLNLLNICSIRGVTTAAGSIWASTQWKNYVQFCNNNIIYYIEQLILRKQITVCNFLHIGHVSCF